MSGSLSNTTAYSQQQFALQLALNPAFITTLASNLATPVATQLGFTVASLTAAISAANNNLLTYGNVSAAGSLSFQQAGGGTLSVGGIIGIVAATLAVTNTGVGGSTSGSAAISAPGTLALAVNVPSVQGPPGGLAYAGSPAGTINLATGVTSGSATLTAGGGGSTTGQSFLTNAGTSSLTGTATVFAAGDLLVNVAGTSYARVPASQPVSTVNQLNLPNGTLLDDGSGNAGFAIVGSDGGALMTVTASAGLVAPVASTGTHTVKNLTVTNSYTGPVATVKDSNNNTLFATGANTVTLAGAPASVSAIGGLNLYTSDGYLITSFDGLGNIITTGQIVSAAGTLGAAASTGTTFTAAELATFDAACMLYSAQNKARPNAGAQRLTTQWATRLTTGASRQAGTLGCPPVNTTQPFDSYMVGQGPQGYHVSPPVAGWTPLVDSVVRPAVAVTSANGVNATQATRTGAFVVTQPVSVTAGSNNGTISWPAQSGLDATTVFANGDTFQMTGWQTATPNNAPTNSANTFTVQSATPNSIVCKDIPVASAATALSTFVPQITAAPESNITIAQTAYNPYGEDPSLAFTNELRLQYLRFKGLTADPTRLYLINGAAAAGPVALCSPVNPAFGNITPNPYLFTRYSNLVSAHKAAAATPGGSLPSGTYSVVSIDDARGGDDGSTIIGSADYFSMYDFYLTSVVATIKSLTGQTAEPIQYISAHSGSNLTEGGPPNNWAAGQSPNQYDLRLNAGNIYRCAVAIASTTTAPTGTGQGIPDGTGSWNWVCVAPTTYDSAPAAMGILRMVGCDPIAGYGQTYAGRNQNRYCYGPGSQTPDRGVHGTNVSYAYEGCMRAKVAYRVEFLGQGFAPCHVIQVYIRGAQIAVGCNVPEGALQIRSPFYFTQPQSWADLGFYCIDKNGVNPVVSAGLAPNTSSQILLNFARNVDVPTHTFRYADNIPATGHNGAGMICDMDPWLPQTQVYNFTAGSGQLLGDSFPNLTSFIQNGKPMPMYNWLCPGAWRGTAH